jgi:hypothetical protein
MTAPPFMIVSQMELLHPTSKRHRHDSYAAFKQTGTRHSALAQTLPAIIRQAEAEGQPYQLTAYPGAGYFIRALPALDAPPRFDVRHEDHVFDTHTQRYVTVTDEPVKVADALNAMDPAKLDAVLECIAAQPSVLPYKAIHKGVCVEVLATHRGAAWARLDDGPGNPNQPDAYCTALLSDLKAT